MYIQEQPSFDIELIEKLEVVAKDIPNLVDAGMDIDFYDQLVGFDMEIVENLVVDDPVVAGDELCATEHLVLSNEIVGVVSVWNVLMEIFMLLLMWS